jgi:hypothetical protein
MDTYNDGALVGLIINKQTGRINGLYVNDLQQVLNIIAKIMLDVQQDTYSEIKYSQTYLTVRIKYFIDTTVGELDKQLANVELIKSGKINLITENKYSTVNISILRFIIVFLDAERTGHGHILYSTQPTLELKSLLQSICASASLKNELEKKDKVFIKLDLAEQEAHALKTNLPICGT